MAKVLSACGVLCSDCPAYHGAEKGVAHQKRTADAWLRIYGRKENFQDISCGGCLGSNDEVFHTSRTCKARLCCISKGFSSCAECPVDHCPDLERAQSVWAGVPELAKILSRADFVNYAKPYCNPRGLIAAARRRFRRPNH